MSGSVWAVHGEVKASELGVTLMHEHLLIDLTCYWSANGDSAARTEPLTLSNLATTRSDPFYLRDNCLLSDWGLAVEEARAYQELGGRTVVDVTVPDIGRDPVGLKRIAQATGLVIIAGCGHYVHIAHPRGLASESVNSIAERFVQDLTEGIDGTSIRAGVIGEIGTSAPIHPDERKVLEAAGQAQASTSAPVTVHLHPGGRTGHEVLDIIESAGGDVKRVALGHLDNDLGRSGDGFDAELAYHGSLADRGCFIQYDCCGNSSYYPSSSYCDAYVLPSDRERIVALSHLIAAGYESHLLLSQDICKKSQLLRYGGVGYGHILREFVHRMRDAGISDSAIDRFLVQNPRRMLAGS